MKLGSIASMYRDLWRAMNLKNKLMLVLVLKLIIIWGLFQFFSDNPYKNTPKEAPAMIAEILKP
ncbi:MAG: hypothetical protein WCW84_02455 [Sulfurimonas sp.]|jgi:hypothetical protein